MYAALRAIPTPNEVVGRLFHAASLLREDRGDGHIAALMIEGVGGLEGDGEDQSCESLHEEQRADRGHSPVPVCPQMQMHESRRRHCRCASQERRVRGDAPSRRTSRRGEHRCRQPTKAATRRRLHRDDRGIGIAWQPCVRVHVRSPHPALVAGDQIYAQPSNTGWSLRLTRFDGRIGCTASSISPRRHDRGWNARAADVVRRHAPRSRDPGRRRRHRHLRRSAGCHRESCRPHGLRSRFVTGSESPNATSDLPVTTNTVLQHRTKIRCPSSRDQARTAGRRGDVRAALVRPITR